MYAAPSLTNNQNPKPMYVDSSIEKGGKRLTSVYGLSDLQTLCLIEALGQCPAAGTSGKVARALYDALLREMNRPQVDYVPTTQKS